MIRTWNSLKTGFKADVQEFKLRVKWKLGSVWPRWNKKPSRYDLWSLDLYLAEVILNSLKSFYAIEKKVVHFDSEEELQKWHDDFGAMIEGFQIYVNRSWDIMSPEEKAKWENAKRLLVEYWESLWT